MIEWDEQKQVMKYSVHASIIARNVIAVLNKRQPPALYQGTHEMISITNGKVGSMFYVCSFFLCLVVFSRVVPVIGAYFGGLHLAIGCLHTLNRRTFCLLGHGKAWVFNHEVFLHTYIYVSLIIINHIRVMMHDVLFRLRAQLDIFISM